MHTFDGTFAGTRNRKLHEDKDWLVQGTERKQGWGRGVQVVTEGMKIQSHSYMVLHCICSNAMSWGGGGSPKYAIQKKTFTYKFCLRFWKAPANWS